MKELKEEDDRRQDRTRQGSKDTFHTYRDSWFVVAFACDPTRQNDHFAGRMCMKIRSNSLERFEANPVMSHEPERHVEALIDLRML